MRLTGLHLLLTYRCTYACSHCFVWGNPNQTGVMTLSQIHHILKAGESLGTVEWIYFEGGEPFLYYPVLVAGAKAAGRAGFQVGMVSNAYWATTSRDALEWLKPLAGTVDRLSLSDDPYHDASGKSRNVRVAVEAATQLGIAVDTISIAAVQTAAEPDSGRTRAAGEAPLVFRGRAVRDLAPLAVGRPWSEFQSCPHEDFIDPKRVHVDYLGNVHLCQGISMGNLFERPLGEICASYEPETHPVVSTIVAGGPAELARLGGGPAAEAYADACHLCCEARTSLRERFPETLAPVQVYEEPA